MGNDWLREEARRLETEMIMNAAVDRAKIEAALRRAVARTWEEAGGEARKRRREAVYYQDAKVELGDFADYCARRAKEARDA